MNKSFLKLNGGESAKISNSQVLTANQWLGKDPKVKGYSTPEIFTGYGKSLRIQEVEQLEQFFDFVKDGVRITGSLITRQDKGERYYKHPAFLQGKSSVGTKIILEGGMKEFLKDYMAGNVSIDFTLEELIEEALNG